MEQRVEMWCFFLRCKERQQVFKSNQMWQSLISTYTTMMDCPYENQTNSNDVGGDGMGVYENRRGKHEKQRNFIKSSER